MRTHWITLILLFSLALGSCGVSQAGTEQAAELPLSDPQFVPSEDSPENPLQFINTPEATEMPSTPPVEKFVALSKKDLASRLGVEANKITLVKTAEMLWLNDALGCPRPGQFYPPGRVPGFQIWLDMEGTQYVYNTDFNGMLILCPELNPHVPNSTTGPTPGVPIK
ncbi:MAG: hypothetical protein ABIU06_08875 [Anaerolineales bacterium]